MCKNEEFCEQWPWAQYNSVFIRTFKHPYRYFSVYGIGGIIHSQHGEEYLPSRPSFYMVRTLSKFMVITLQI